MNPRLASFWQRAAETAVAALLLAAPVAVLMKTYDPGALRSVVFQLGALAAVLVWALKSLERGRFELSSSASPWLVPAAGLAAWAVLRWAFEPARAAGLPAAVDALLFFGLFAAAGLELGGYRSVARLSGWALAAAWVVALQPSFFLSPEAAACYFAVCVPLAAFKRLDPERDEWLKRFDLGLLVLLAAGAAWTGSASGLFAFGLSSLVTAAALAGFVPSRAARREAVVLVGVLAGAVLAAAVFKSGAVGRDALYQLEARRALWPAALSTAFSQPLFGLGLAGFEAELSRRPPVELITLTGAHGARLSAAGEAFTLFGRLGLVGVLLALAALAGLWRSVLRARRAFAQTAGVGELTALACLTAAVFGPLLASLFGAGSPRDLPWLFAPLAGALGGLTLLAPRDRVVRVIPLGLSPQAVKRAYAPAAVLALAVAVLPGRWLAADLTLNQGAALASAGKHEEAAALLARVPEASPSGPAALYFKGNALLESGDPKGALEAYARLDALMPGFAQADYFAALAHARAGQWAEAVARASRQSERDPLFAPNLALLADAALQTGDLAAARKAALAAVALEPNDPMRWSSLSAIYAKERKTGEAQDALRRARALKRRPRDG